MLAVALHVGPVVVLQLHKGLLQGVFLGQKGHGDMEGSGLLSESGAGNRADAVRHQQRTAVVHVRGHALGESTLGQRDARKGVHGSLQRLTGHPLQFVHGLVDHGRFFPQRIEDVVLASLTMAAFTKGCRPQTSIWPPRRPHSPIGPLEVELGDQLEVVVSAAEPPHIRLQGDEVLPAVNVGLEDLVRQQNQPVFLAEAHDLLQHLPGKALTRGIAGIAHPHAPRIEALVPSVL